MGSQFPPSNPLNPLTMYLLYILGCSCNGEKFSILGLGGKCTNGKNSANANWCSVDQDSGCDDLQIYNGHPISYLACAENTTTTVAAVETICEPGEWLKYPECPPEWQRYEDSCYYFGTTSLYYLSWAKAASLCQGKHKNSTLPSVHSAKEGQFLQDNVSSDQFWLGASRNVGADYQEPSSWTWSDGTAMNYTAWASGQPNNYLWQERCVKSVKGEGEKKWDDHKCWRKISRDFVCKLQLQGGIRRNGELLKNY